MNTYRKKFEDKNIRRIICNEEEAQEVADQISQMENKKYRNTLVSLLEVIEMKCERLYQHDDDFAPEWDFILDLRKKLYKIYFG